MRSLLVRIFVSFWLIIVVTTIVAAVLGFDYADRAQGMRNDPGVRESLHAASRALKRGNRPGLTQWLNSQPGDWQARIYILDERDRDLLGRRLPVPIRIALNRIGGPRQQRRPESLENIRPARPFTELVGRDGRAYTVFILPEHGKVGRWFANRSLAGLGFFALLLSAAVSYVLARAVSRPVRRLRESARAIAAGDLSARVGDSISLRNDEIGLLARDFDRMATELQRAADRQTELTRNVSHELRSPLARLRVALELARRKTGEHAELERIDRETERLDALIGQILAFSRLNADSADTTTTIDLAELVTSIANDVRFEFSQRGSALKIAVDAAAPCTVVANENALTASIENIVRNAAVHGGSGGRIDITVATQDDWGQLQVQDYGGGVASADLVHLFEPFFRAGTKPADRDPGGSGLGLAIAARAAALIGGALEARNEAGGLLLTLRVPLAPP